MVLPAGKPANAHVRLVRGLRGWPRSTAKFVTWYWIDVFCVVSLKASTFNVYVATLEGLASIVGLIGACTGTEKLPLASATAVAKAPSPDRVRFSLGLKPVPLAVMTSSST